ncbi:hypothetical protein CGZ93_03150 [Enemella dayhoffiae]|uniref:Outer membrane channel protein CpnT-like N-terminal domain-containing protein n=1 Tax=Enemella dayhoffiae TaxID=2016507 RepID=A0A255HB02_9ACTN|nr:hypothetical protein [Enemella dayhoffiae]OYO24702.1 hypothetical protein CGZ93_03150 [Enemella dayhoffiae]
MSLMLPGALVTYLNQLGIKWPEGDEQKTFDYGKKWLEMGGTVKDAGHRGQAAGDQLDRSNQGDAASAFKKSYGAEKGPVKNSGKLATGLKLGGGVLYVAAGAILVLKIYAIVQLVQLMIKTLQAIAAAPSTFGASLKLIPVFQSLAKTAINGAIDKVIGELAGGKGGASNDSQNPTYGVFGDTMGDQVRMTDRLQQPSATTA